MTYKKLHSNETKTCQEFAKSLKKLIIYKKKNFWTQKLRTESQKKGLCLCGTGETAKRSGGGMQKKDAVRRGIVKTLTLVVLWGGRGVKKNLHGLAAG